ncbi:MAG: SDR family oxidoreductase [Candidatus Latescibacterota bacterium]
MSADILERFSLKDQVALVTGAAGQLGRQFCRTLGQAGATIAVVDQNEDACHSFTKELETDGIPALSLPFDITNTQATHSGFDQVKDKLGRLDVLINCAGLQIFAPFEERTFEDFMRVLEVNAGGTFLCTQTATKIMKHQKTGGRIINIGSLYGVVSGDPRIYTDCSRNTSEVYGGSKAAVIQMTRYWAVHLAQYNIRVNAISPGGVFNHQGEDFVSNYSYRTPMGRMAKEDELSCALLFLATEASSYVNGHNLVVDGGWTAW